MKLIDYKCESCGNIVEDWDKDVFFKMQDNNPLSCILPGKKCKCGKVMTPQPWMNNKLPTCGVK
jgi:hypothetical protein